MEQSPSERHEKLAVISNWAKEEFSPDALFVYFKNKEAFTLTLDEAIQVCGEHIAGAPLEMVQTMLRDMQEKAERIKALAQGNPEVNARYEASISRGQAVLARRALQES